MRMPTRPVGMAVPTVAVAVVASTPIVAMAAAMVDATLRAVTRVATVLPWCWTVADAFLGPADDGPATDHLLGLLATGGARNELEDIGHRHTLFCPGAARSAIVFVECHARIVGCFPATVNLAPSYTRVTTQHGRPT